MRQLTIVWKKSQNYKQSYKLGFIVASYKLRIPRNNVSIERQTYNCGKKLSYVSLFLPWSKKTQKLIASILILFFLRIVSS